ncbi:hypothetical protein VKA52_08105 [Halobacillus sp. HZG1]|nr:hypothetical protein [Halobacillus sp. HZG1]
MENILKAFYELLPVLVMVFIVFSTIYLRDKEDFRKQFQGLKKHKIQITFVMITVILFPFVILLLIYILKNIATVLG